MQHQPVQGRLRGWLDDQGIIRCPYANPVASLGSAKRSQRAEGGGRLSLMGGGLLKGRAKPMRKHDFIWRPVKLKDGMTLISLLHC